MFLPLSDSPRRRFDADGDADDGNFCSCCFESRDAVTPILTPAKRRRRRSDERRHRRHHRRRRDDDDDDDDSYDDYDDDDDGYVRRSKGGRRGGGRVRREQKSIEIQCDLPSFEALPPGVMPPSPQERNRSSVQSDKVSATCSFVRFFTLYLTVER